jgi:LPPG:FO 2-phospho-L-lactate transferase
VSGNVVVLTGGVGGAKLVLGLAQILEPDKVIAVVNTGDDFRHFGLWVCPDLDTLLYTLAGKASAEHGWGREGETWKFMEALRSLGGEDWFLLGDGDMALHILRSAQVASGARLSRIAAGFARAWNVKVRMLPMSDDPVATRLATDEGDLSFQGYFVGRRCAPIVRSIRFEGATAAKPAPGVISALRDADTRAILIAPSNPFLSIDPILAIPDIRSTLMETHVPVVAVSPIVGGRAVKGPTAKLMLELGMAVTPEAIANHYAGIIDGMLVDERDSFGSPGIATGSADTLMISLKDRARVAAAALALADRIAS